MSDLSQRMLVAAALIALVVLLAARGKEPPPPGLPGRAHRYPLQDADAAFRKFREAVLEGRPVDGKGAREYFEKFRSIGFVPSVALGDRERPLKLARQGDLERRTWAAVLISSRRDP